MICSLGVAKPCLGDTFLLKNGEKVEGTLKEFKDGVYVVQVGDQQKKLSKDEVVSIETSSVAAAAPAFAPSEKIPDAMTADKNAKYGSPEKTFLLWKQAAIQGDNSAMADCYLMSKKQKKELDKIPRDRRKEMAEVTKKTEFSIGQTVFQGNRATLEVTWTLGLQSDSKVLQFMLDGKDWKIVE